MGNHIDALDRKRTGLSQPQEIAVGSLTHKGVRIRPSCRTFCLSGCFCRYEPKRRAVSERIGYLLIGLTRVHRTRVSASVICISTMKMVTLEPKGRVPDLPDTRAQPEDQATQVARAEHSEEISVPDESNGT
jgi:hypothetical protein